METIDVRAIVRKQLQELSNRSQEGSTGIGELCDLTNAMSELINSMDGM